MANPTTYFGWVMPTATDLVTDLPADFNTFGQGVDTSMQDLLGGTTGQVLSKTSGTNMDFTWINNDVGDITAVTVTSPITGGGTSGSVAIGFDATAATTLTLNAQTGTTYTLVLADAANKLVTSSNASAVVITLPPSVFSTGQQINVQSIGVGLTSFTAGAGVTITSTGASAAAPILRARYSACTVVCNAANSFTVIGDLS
jgi:hypothetical protein